jgi:hypothetical protein
MRKYFFLLIVIIPHALKAQHADKYFQFGMVVSSAIDHTGSIKYSPEICVSLRSDTPVNLRKNLYG